MEVEETCGETCENDAVVWVYVDDDEAYCYCVKHLKEALVAITDLMD